MMLNRTGMNFTLDLMIEIGKIYPSFEKPLNTEVLSSLLKMPAPDKNGFHGDILKYYADWRKYPGDKNNSFDTMNYLINLLLNNFNKETFRRKSSSKVGREMDIEQSDSSDSFPQDGDFLSDLFIVIKYYTEKYNLEMPDSENIDGVSTSMSILGILDKSLSNKNQQNEYKEIENFSNINGKIEDSASKSIANELSTTRMDEESIVSNNRNSDHHLHPSTELEDESKTIIPDECLRLLYKPDCYVKGIQALSVQKAGNSHVIKELDYLLVRFLSAKEIMYINDEGAEVEVKKSDLDDIWFEILKGLSLLSAQIGNLQSAVNDWMQLKLWKVIFSISKDLDIDLLKEWGIKLLVDYMEDMNEIQISQITESFLKDERFEAIFKFIRTSKKINFSMNSHCFVLVSKFSLNKKAFQYLIETECYEFLFDRIISFEPHFLLLHQAGWENIYSNSWTWISEGLIDIANISVEQWKHIQKMLESFLKKVLSMQQEAAELVKHFFGVGSVPAIQNENSTLTKYWGEINEENIDLKLILLERIMQSLIYFFIKFLDIQASNLASSMLENNFLEQLVEIYTIVPMLRWRYWYRRKIVLEEILHIFPDNTNIGLIFETLFTIGYKQMLQKVKECQRIGSCLADSDYTVILKNISDKKGNSIFNGWMKDVSDQKLALDYIENYFKVVMLSSLINLRFKVKLVSLGNNKEQITEEEHMEFVDAFIKEFVQRELKHNISVHLDRIKRKIAKERLLKTPKEDLNKMIAVINSKNIAVNISSTLWRITETLFKNNLKFISKMVFKLKEWFTNVENIKMDNVLEDLLYRFELGTIFWYLARFQPSTTSINGFYESGVYKKYNDFFTETMKRVSPAIQYLNSKKIGSDDMTTDDFILMNILNQSSNRLYKYTVERFYQIPLCSIDEEAKYYKNGKELIKDDGIKILRFVKIRIFEMARDYVVSSLIENSENYITYKPQAKHIEEELSKGAPLSSVLYHPDLWASFRDIENSFNKSLYRTTMKDFFTTEKYMSSKSSKNNNIKQRLKDQVKKKLLEYGFPNHKIDHALTKVRNPVDFNEILEWLLANPDAGEDVENQEANKNNKIDEEKPIVKEELLPTTFMKFNDFKQEMHEIYKKYCLTLFKYFLYIPVNLDMYSLIEIYVQHTYQAGSINSVGFKLCRQFIFDLYYHNVELFFLLRSEMWKLKTNEDIMNWNIVLPDKICKVKKFLFQNLSNGGNKGSLPSIEIIPRKISNWDDRLKKLRFLFYDIKRSLKMLIDLLKFAGFQGWTPGCANELRLIYLFTIELMDFTTRVVSSDLLKSKDGETNNQTRDNNVENFINDIKKTFQKCFLLIQQIVRVRQVSQPVIGQKEKYLTSFMNIKAVEQANNEKNNVCQKFLLLTKNFLKLNKVWIQNVNHPFLTRHLFSLLISTFTDWIKVSKENKDMFLKKNLISPLLRATTILESDSNGSIADNAWTTTFTSNLQSLLLCLIEDPILIEKSIESEIRYFFYCLKKKNDNSTNNSSKSKSKDELSMSVSKLDGIDEFPLDEFNVRFSHIGADHPEIFFETIGRIWVVNRKIVPVDEKDKKKKKDNKNNKKDFITLTSPIKESIIKKELSEETRKAVVIILTEIIAIFIKQFQRLQEYNEKLEKQKEEGQVDKKEHFEDYIVSTKIIMDAFFSNIVSKYPILHLIISKYDCLKVVKALAKNDFITSAYKDTEKLSFVSFFVRSILMINRNLFQYMWPFLDNSHILVLQNRKILPMNALYRRELIKELYSMINNTSFQFPGVKTVGCTGKMDIELANDNNETEEIKNQIRNLMEIRNNVHFLMNITSDYECLKTLLDKNPPSEGGFEAKISPKLLEYLQHMDAIEISKYKDMLDIIYHPLSLLYKYNAVINLNKSKLEGLNIYHYVDSKEFVIAKQYQELTAPKSLLLKWGAYYQEMNCKESTTKKSKSFLFSAPWIVSSKGSFELAKASFKPNKTNVHTINIRGREYEYVRIIREDGGEDPSNRRQLLNLGFPTISGGITALPNANMFEEEISDGEADGEHGEGMEMEMEESEDIVQYYMEGENLPQEVELHLDSDEDDDDYIEDADGETEFAVTVEEEEASNLMETEESEQFINERVNTLVERERDNIPAKFFRNHVKDNPSQVVNIYMMDKQKESVGQIVESVFKAYWAKFKNQRTTKSLIDAIFKFEEISNIESVATIQKESKKSSRAYTRSAINDLLLQRHNPDPYSGFDDLIGGDIPGSSGLRLDDFVGANEIGGIGGGNPLFSSNIVRDLVARRMDGSLAGLQARSVRGSNGSSGRGRGIFAARTRRELLMDNDDLEPFGLDNMDSHLLELDTLMHNAMRGRGRPNRAGDGAGLFSNMRPHQFRDMDLMNDMANLSPPSSMMTRMLESARVVDNTGIPDEQPNAPINESADSISSETPNNQYPIFPELRNHLLRDFQPVPEPPRMNLMYSRLMNFMNLRPDGENPPVNIPRPRPTNQNLFAPNNPRINTHHFSTPEQRINPIPGTNSNSNAGSNAVPDLFEAFNAVLNRNRIEEEVPPPVQPQSLPLPPNLNVNNNTNNINNSNNSNATGGSDARNRIENEILNMSPPNPVAARIDNEPLDEIVENFNFSEFGLPQNFLEISGIDQEYFYQIPYELQVETIMANINSTMEVFHGGNRHNEYNNPIPAPQPIAQPLENPVSNPGDQTPTSQTLPTPLPNNNTTNLLAAHENEITEEIERENEEDSESRGHADNDEVQDTVTNSIEQESINNPIENEHEVNPTGSGAIIQEGDNNNMDNPSESLPTNNVGISLNPTTTGTNTSNTNAPNLGNTTSPSPMNTTNNLNPFVGQNYEDNHYVVPPPPFNTRYNTNNNTGNNTNNNTGNNTNANTGNNTNVNTGNNTGQNSPRGLIINNQRNEIIEEQPRDNPQNIQNEERVNPQANENEAFLNGLTPEMRREVLMECPEEFLQNMNPEILEEARRLRERNSRTRIGYQIDDILHSMNNIRSTINNIREKPMKNLALFKIDPKIASKMFLVDENAISGILLAIWSGSSMKNYYYTLLSSICMNPENELKIFDAFHFIITNFNYFKQKFGPVSSENCDDNSSKRFPTINIFNEGFLQKKDENAFIETSWNILLLLEWLSENHTLYFQREFVTVEKEKQGVISFQPSFNFTPLESIAKLRRENNTCTKGTFNELLDLIIYYKNKASHLEVLLKIIHRFIESWVSSDDEDKSKEHCPIKLDKEKIKLFWDVLHFSKIDEGIIKTLGSLISVLCLNNENLNNFIGELTNTIFSLSNLLNVQFETDLSILKDCIQNPTEDLKQIIEFSIIKRQNQSNFNEKRFLKIFNLILQLYEKSLERANNKEKAEAERLKKEQEGQEKTEPGNTNSGTLGGPLPTQSIGGDSSARLDSLSPVRQESTEKKDFEKEALSRVWSEVRERFSSLMRNESLMSLWLSIWESLNYLERIFRNKEKIMSPVISGMKPLIESFFIKYKILWDDEMFNKINDMLSKSKVKDSVKKKIAGLKEDMKEEQESSLLNLDFSQLRKMELGINELFLIMWEKNRNVINKMISQNISLLFRSLSVIPKKMPKILDFENKKTYFRNSLDNSQRSLNNLNLSIRREEIFADSFNQIISKQPAQLKANIHVEFRGEEGEDAGGVAREWFLNLSKKIFHPGYALFIPSANGATYQPSPQSHINSEHIRYFKFIGRVIGKALHDGFLMDAFFTRSFYKHMTGAPLTIEDMEDIDPDYYKNLKYFLENDVTDLDLTFSYEAEDFGKFTTKELIPGGTKIQVTNENKRDFVNKI